MPREFKNNGLAGFLAALGKNQMLADFNLTLYGNRDVDDIMSSNNQLGSIVRNTFIREAASPFIKNHILDVMKSKRPVIRRLKGGLFCLLVPVRMGDDYLCLVGDGVRENSIDVDELEDFSKKSGKNVFEVIEKIEELPVKTVEDLKLAVIETQKMFASHGDEKSNLFRINNARNQIASVIKKISGINSMNSCEDVMSLSVDILSDLFGCVNMAVVLRNEKEGGFAIKRINGPDMELPCFPESKLALFVNPDPVAGSVNLDKETRNLFLLPEACKATSFPLVTQGVVLGFIAVFDHDPDLLDEILTKLLADGITDRLHAMKSVAEHAFVGSLSNSLMSLANILLFAESKEELYRNILEISADMVRASRGSIMLVDNNGKNLQIAFSKGMNQGLARSINVRMGEGIAGKVAKSGVALLVDDVEKDGRVRMANRPRFRTKSLLCVPLKLKEKTIGVLNLSDKENLERFKVSDLNMLASFADLASLMIERAWTLERSSILEKLSVTDYLTGLYNHRFLKNRLEEELSRSARNRACVTVIFIDLDFFKIYNDLSGHLAGDAALKKTADILRASVREMDTVVRYGGEEFCIVLPETTKEEAVVVAERIRMEIEMEKFSNEKDMPFGCLTASFGIATFPEDGLSYTTLIHSADLALYGAKTGGRNRIVLGRPVLQNGENPQRYPDGG